VPPNLLGPTGIYYYPSTKQLYAGSDPPVILDDTLDADLIAELAGIFRTGEGISDSDWITFSAGIATHVDLRNYVDRNRAAALLNTVDVTMRGGLLVLGVNETLTVPAGKTLTLKNEDSSRIGKITLAKDGTNPGKIVLSAGAPGALLVIDATGTGEAVASAAAAFTATGSGTDFVDTANSSTVITDTAALVKSIQAGAGFSVTIKADAALDGTIDSTSKFEDAS
jgi:hypothetical protein